LFSCVICTCPTGHQYSNAASNPKGASRFFDIDEEGEDDAIGDQMGSANGANGTKRISVTSRSANAMLMRRQSMTGLLPTDKSSSANGRNVFHGVVVLRDPAFSWPMQPPARLPSTLLSLSFNVWEYNADDLMMFAFDMFDELGLIDEFKITPVRLQHFIMHVRSNYRTFFCLLSSWLSFS
jgi:hypothetical protein